MAPTICDDNMEPYGIRSSNRLRRQCSVINYAGNQIRRDIDERRNQVVDSSDDKNRIQRCDRDQLSEQRRINSIKRYRLEINRVTSDSDNSSDSSISSPMTFHNYAKRRRLSETEDENYISTSSESNDQTVSSTISSSSSLNDDSDRENMTKFSISRIPFAPYSPVSSTTGALSLYHRLSKASPRELSPFYRQDLMEIAMKTIILLQKNRSLHARLHQLKVETRAFVDSVMANPENAKLRQPTNQSNDHKPIDHPAFKVLGVKNQ